MQVNRSQSLKGRTAFISTIPSSDDLVVPKTDMHNELCHRFAIENSELSINDVNGKSTLCPMESRSLTAKSSSHCCKPVDSAHMLFCKFVNGGMRKVHDVMRDTFWLPLAKLVFGPLTVSKETKDVFDKVAAKDKRPIDIDWQAGTCSGTGLIGMDIGYTNFTQKVVSKGLVKSARKTAYYAKYMEQKN